MNTSHLEGPGLFSASYGQSRAAFLQAAAAAGARVTSHTMALTGADGEPLALDVAVHGDPEAPRLVLTTSAVHGIEGFCGSALQRGMLQALRPPPGVVLVHVHAVNPHGFSWRRRVNEDNVDLNRNFIDFSRLPQNADYAQVHDLLLPAQWPPGEAVERALAAYEAQWGARRLQRAITGGQYAYPQGLWFGGHGPTWSQRTFRRVLRDHAGRARDIAWIDLHTGLGPWAHGERIFACSDTGATLERARRWWGPDITSVHTGSSHSVPLSGPIQMAIYDECPKARYTGICLEFGTEPLDVMIRALRGDHWLALHPQAPAGLARELRAAMVRAFSPDSADWQARVWAQGLEAARQAMAGLTTAD